VWQPQAKGKQLVTLDNAGAAGATTLGVPHCSDSHSTLALAGPVLSLERICCTGMHHSLRKSTYIYASCGTHTT
jgi:hypothetical protein